MTSVHVLYYGRVLCGMLHGLPSGWGDGLEWVSAFDPLWREQATCRECRRSRDLLERAA